MEDTGEPNESNERYRTRYKLLRKSAKQLAYENAAMCQEISRLEEKTATAKTQRKYLLKKLFQLEKPEHRTSGQKNPRRSNLVATNRGMGGTRKKVGNEQPTEDIEVGTSIQTLQVT
uniref:Transforming growth factor beta regulator 1 n=1 Tax=Ciona savignyi TaxID=51511 RepID=H2ZCG3_CIOSA